MNAPWPIASYLLLGLKGGAGDGALRSRVGRGPHRQRRMYSAVPEPLAGRMILTGSEFEAFRSWGKSTLKEWTLPFDCPEPGSLVPRAYQFTEPKPTWEFVVNGVFPSGRWMVDVAMETIP